MSCYHMLLCDVYGVLLYYLLNVSVLSHMTVGSTPDGADWVVTYFAKTLFTPKGMDIYSRSSRGLSTQMIDDIKKALQQIGEENNDKEFIQLVNSIFPVAGDERE